MRFDISANDDECDSKSILMRDSDSFSLIISVRNTKNCVSNAREFFIIILRHFYEILNWLFICSLNVIMTLRIDLQLKGYHK